MAAVSTILECLLECWILTPVWLFPCFRVYWSYMCFVFPSHVLPVLFLASALSMNAHDCTFNNKCGVMYMWSWQMTDWNTARSEVGYFKWDTPTSDFICLRSCSLKLVQLSMFVYVCQILDPAHDVFCAESFVSYSIHLIFFD